MEYGGVYADKECLKSFEELGNNMNDAECYAGIEAEWDSSDFPEFQTEEFPHGLIAQGTIDFILHSSTMMAMIVGLSAANKDKDVWIASGPYFFTQTIMRYVLPVKILPAWVFYPIYHSKNLKLKLLMHLQLITGELRKAYTIFVNY